MAKKISILGVAIIMALGLFVGCNSGIKYNISYDKMGGFGQKEVDNGITMDILEIVNSLQELKDLCNEWSNPAFNESSEYFSSESSVKIRSYDEAFFSEKALIIYSFWRGYSKETRISNMSIDGTQLIINARYVSKRGTFDDVSFNWLFLIELNKTDISDVTTVQIKHK